jgi:hypothetical protein
MLWDLGILSFMMDDHQFRDYVSLFWAYTQVLYIFNSNKRLTCETTFGITCSLFVIYLKPIVMIILETHCFLMCCLPYDLLYK